MERLKTVDELAYTDLDGLTQFITEVRRGRFADPTAMAKSTLLVSLLKSAVSTALIHRYPSPNMQDLTGVAFFWCLAYRARFSTDSFSLPAANYFEGQTGKYQL